MRIAMIPITTSSSTSVKPVLDAVVFIVERFIGSPQSLSVCPSCGSLVKPLPREGGGSGFGGERATSTAPPQRGGGGGGGRTGPLLRTLRRRAMPVRAPR